MDIFSYKNILESILVCPECNSGPLEIKNFDDCNSGLEGYCCCKSCSGIFKIENGIINLIKYEFCELISEITFFERHKIELNGRYDNKINILKKNNPSKNNQDIWKKEEKDYWDNYYSQQNAKLKIGWYNYNRLEPRKQEIVEYIKDNIKGKLVVEFGGGSSSAIYHIMNPEKYEYIFICSDISIQALINARMLHPNSILIQCDACSPPFKDNSIDVIINFGSLHHLPDNNNVLIKHIGCLKSRGYMGIHEPSDKRKKILKENNIIKRKLAHIELSEHDEYVEEITYLNVFNDRGKIINLYYEYTIIRAVLISIFFDKFKINNKAFYLFARFFDKLSEKTLGKVFNLFKPSSMIVLFRKS